MEEFIPNGPEIADSGSNFYHFFANQRSQQKVLYFVVQFLR